jgi:hypothetical protein
MAKTKTKTIRRHVDNPRLEKLDLRWVSTLALPTWAASLEARGCAVYR